jgi:hypothetical protein
VIICDLPMEATMRGGLRQSSRSSQKTAEGERPNRKDRRTRQSFASKKTKDHTVNPSQCSVDETCSPRFISKQKPIEIPSSGKSYSEGLHDDIDRNSFIRTNSSIFFESNPDPTLAMKPIPISPMFEAKPGMLWATEFFGRGGTSGPSSRADNKVEHLMLPDVNAKPNAKRALFSREGTAFSPENTMAMSPISVPGLHTSPPVHSSRGISRPSLSASAIRPSPVKDVHQSELHEETAIEPWAVKIISKYQSKSVVRPKSRCTARLQQEHDAMGGGLMGPPMSLGNAMTKSKSLSHMPGTVASRVAMF